MNTHDECPECAIPRPLINRCFALAIIAAMALLWWAGERSAIMPSAEEDACNAVREVAPELSPRIVGDSCVVWDGLQWRPVITDKR